MTIPLLQMQQICKSYPGVQAVDQVSLNLFAGEVLGLMGENGAELLKHAQGQSYVDLVLENISHHHETVLTGYHGKDISICDGKTTYTHQALKDSIAYHHTLMPRSFSNFYLRELLAQAEYGEKINSKRSMPLSGNLLVWACETVIW